MSIGVTPTEPFAGISTPLRVSEITIIWSDCGNGSGRSKTPSTIEKIAVVAPMPNAKIRRAAVTNPGDLIK
jgi:hypothetical protein